MSDDVKKIAEKLTATQRDCLMHTTGKNQNPVQDRNYFCASPGTPDDLALSSMAEMGVTKCHSPFGTNKHMPYNTYHATELGLSVARELEAQG